MFTYGIYDIYIYVYMTPQLHMNLIARKQTVRVCAVVHHIWAQNWSSIVELTPLLDTL